jgi:hypothetical protein
MPTEDIQKRGDPPVTIGTWAGVASQLVQTASESWPKLARICILLLVVAVVGVAWWWLPRIW